MTERPEKIQYQTDPERQEQVLYEHYRFYAGYGEEPLRIDKFLMNKISHISRSRIQEGIKANQVLINDTPVKSNHKVKAGQTVKVVLPRPPEDMVLKAEAIPLDLVYEDHYVVVVNKPAGMVVHPGINNHSGTLVNALMHYFHTLPETINGHDRPGIVHRIDKETSGLLVVAKQKLAINSLFDQFAQKTVDRQYLALVWGEPACDSGTIEGNLARSERNRKAMAVYEDPEIGKPAVTHYQVIARFGYASLVKCVLETGRTHQIRAHMKYLGHPVFNDKLYGGDKLAVGPSHAKYRQFVSNCQEVCPRQALHAQSLIFQHPKGWQPLTLAEPLPPDFRALVVKWRDWATQKGMGDTRNLLLDPE